MSARTRTRGQSGLTLIELLIVTALAAIVLGPVVGVAYTVMHRTKPTKESSEASKQLRVFRTVLADDWASASEIVIDPASVYVNCSGPSFGTGLIRIAMATSYKVDGKQLRILYRQVANTDGTVRIKREVCEHPGTWGYGGHTNVAPLGRNAILLKQVRALVIPTGHGCNTSTAPPFPACDMNVTVIGADGNRQVPFNPFSPYTSDAQRSTVRLHQMVGPVS